MSDSLATASKFLLAVAVVTSCKAASTAPTCSVGSLNLSALVTTVVVRQSVAVVPTATAAAAAQCTAAQLEDVTWSSEDPAVATVNAVGRVTGAAPGVARITATLLDRTASLDIRVDPTPVYSVAVSPAAPRLEAGQSQQLSTACFDRDAIATPCSAAAIWRTVPAVSPVASVSNDGVLTATAAGIVPVSATVGTVTGQTTLTVAAPGSLVFAMNYSAAAAPLAGWSGMRADNADHTMTRVAGVGPSGQDGYRMTMDVTGPNGGDNYWGHGGVFTGAPFAYGDRAYFRWRFRWRPGTDCRAYQQGGTGLESGVWRNKILIVNDASSSLTSRFIIQLECLGFLNTGGAPRFYLKLAKGGGVDPAQTPDYPLNTDWVDVQVEMQYSSAFGVADGAYRIWINSNTRATPTAQATNIRLYADANPGYVQFGAYFNNGLYPGGVVAWEHIDFQIDDDFDIGWDIP